MLSFSRQKIFDFRGDFTMTLQNNFKNKKDVGNSLTTQPTPKNTSDNRSCSK